MRRVPRSSKHRWLIAGLLGLASASAPTALGLAGCRSATVLPDERVSAAEQAWVTGQNNPSCDAGACPDGQVVTCGNVCVTPVSIGYGCTQVDCQPTSVCERHFGSSCVDLGSGNPQFICALPPTGKEFWSECDPTRNECPADLYCKDNPGCYPSSSVYAFCAVGVDEGFSCDSDWEDTYSSSHLKCAPCMPGTTCLGGYCHKSCTSASDCPCGNYGETIACFTDSTSSAQHCYPCQGLGGQCDGEHKCCNTTTQNCGSGSTCCLNVGETCSAQSDCCANDAEVCLAATNHCGACLTINQTCAADGDCCAGRCNTSNLCRPLCEDFVGKPCSAESSSTGECKANAVWSCVNDEKVCVDGSSSTETCDGKDNDCDGVVDDIPEAACSNPIASDFAQCQSGFAPAGHYVCQNGTSVCRTKQQHDFCVICGPLDDNSDSCGVCAGNSCDSSHPCGPGASCVSDVCQADTYACPSPAHCWHPEQIEGDNSCCEPTSCTP